MAGNGWAEAQLSKQKRRKRKRKTKTEPGPYDGAEFPAGSFIDDGTWFDHV
jgi:hypothetical protein